MLVRDGISFDKLKEITKEKNFAWEKIPEIPSDIPLYFLQDKDSKIAQEAASSSCEQNMVANVQFSSFHKMTQYRLHFVVVCLPMSMLKSKSQKTFPCTENYTGKLE